MNNKTILRPDYIRLEFNGEPLQYAAADEIISATLTEAFDSSNGISMGSACSSKFTVSLLLPDILTGGRVRVPYADSFLIPYACFADESHEDMPLGKFYVTDVEKSVDGKMITLICYDGFCKLDCDYTFDTTKEGTLENIMGDMAHSLGFSVNYDFTPYADYVISEFYNSSARQLIGHIAGLMGKNARFDRNGDLTFDWYKTANDTPAIQITEDSLFGGQFNLLSEDDIIISAVFSGTQDNMIGQDLPENEGRFIAFENPYITEPQLENILNTVKGLTYRPCSLKYRGDLYIEPGMLVEVVKGETIIPICVMEQTTIFNGGMSSEILCFADEDSGEIFQSSFIANKLTPKNESRLSKLITIKNKISGSKGGIFEIIDADNDGIQDGFVLREGNGTGNYILANNEGIILMKRLDDGTFEPKTAIDFNGINADSLDVDDIRAKCFTITGHNVEDVFSISEEEGSDKGLKLKISSSKSGCYLEQSSDSFGFYNSTAEGASMLIGPSSISMGMMTIYFNSFGDILFSTGGK